MQRARRLASNRKPIVAGVALLIGVGVILLGYGDWKTQRLLSQTESLLTKGDTDGAILMARSAYGRIPQNEEARRLLLEAYHAKRDPRVLDLLADGESRRLVHTLKAIELGLLPEAKSSFMKLVPGHSVDTLSYHELGALLFKDDPERLLEHASVIADLNPREGEGLLRLAMASMRVGVAYPERHLASLAYLAREGRSPFSADAAAIALTLSLTSSRTVSWPASAVELAGRLQLYIEASTAVRPSYLRAFEACHGGRPTLESGLLSSLTELCDRLKSGPDTRRLAECLVRLGKRESLIEWFEESPESFPLEAIDQPQNAFARLLVADVAAGEARWDLVTQIVGENTSEQWGELRFLRHFYEGRLIRERLQGDRALLDRERQILAEGKVREAVELATLPWQRAVLAELSRKYL